MMVRELTHYGENTLNNVMKLGGHVDCHNFVCSVNKGTEASRSIMRRICCPNRLLVLTKTVTYEAR